MSGLKPRQARRPGRPPAWRTLIDAIDHVVVGKRPTQGLPRLWRAQRPGDRHRHVADGQGEATIDEQADLLPDPELCGNGVVAISASPFSINASRVSGSVTTRIATP